MATAQAVAEDAQAQILKHFTHWDAETWSANEAACQKNCYLFDYPEA